ncbi:helix-turn-helix transcriptional regulator [Haloplanus sp.]|uniref:helix-turn-helix transcriptional regulator n=1 Tax=Haloplanus sp. TaxID=1961696 RepID=UPI00262452B7|nr:helix-turn-helix transcriptional regulator [Haloplanus sp.]
MNNEITTYREHEGLSQGELAESVGVSRQTVNAIERDRYDPSLELAFKLAVYFDCRIEDLFQPDIEPVGE